MLPPLSTFPSRPSRGFTGRELRGQFQGGELLSGQWDEFFQQNVCWGWHWCWKRQGKELNCGFRGTKTLVELRWKLGWIKAQIWKLETKQVKRVFPASCGRPDNSWAAAKTVAGSNFTGAGHVTWLLLTTSYTYSQAHVWTHLLWEPRQQGGLNQPN